KAKLPRRCVLFVRDGVESVFALPWNRRSLWCGLAVRFAWNTHSSCIGSKWKLARSRTGGSRSNNL
ncbi:hypothetical protein C9I56_42285, partial [Paraburkholderia caribensis]